MENRVLEQKILKLFKSNGGLKVSAETAEGINEREGGLKLHIFVTVQIMNVNVDLTFRLLENGDITLYEVNGSGAGVASIEETVVSKVPWWADKIPTKSVLKGHSYRTMLRRRY